MAQTTWNIDGAHSQVEFGVRHLMISTVRGRFTTVSGSVSVDDAAWTNASVNAVIDVASINTAEGARDNHLRSADFFDAENHPSITFVSRRVEGSSPAQFKLIGDLTIRGTTREVTLDVSEEGRGKDPWGGERIAFSAKTAIDRSAFGLTWNQALETGGVVVGNEVKITLDIQLVKQAA